MDRYHLAWLMVGKPKEIIRGRPMTPEEEAAYVREVAGQKTAALRMSLDAVERQGMPFKGETGGLGRGRAWARCRRSRPGPIARGGRAGRLAESPQRGCRASRHGHRAGPARSRWIRTCRPASTRPAVRPRCTPPTTTPSPRTRNASGADVSRAIRGDRAQRARKAAMPAQPPREQRDDAVPLHHVVERAQRTPTISAYTQSSRTPPPPPSRREAATATRVRASGSRPVRSRRARAR